MTNVFVPMAYNNAWANHRLISACEKLTQEEFEAERVSFFPTLKATLNHNLTVDRFYVDALEGGDLGSAAFDEDEPCVTPRDLKEKQEKVDRRLIQFCKSLRPDDHTAITAINRGPYVQEELTDRLLLHLFQHQIHHRGQVHAMLSGTSVKPPQLDEFLMSGERARNARAGDMEALGWTEEEIWGT